MSIEKITEKIISEAEDNAKVLLADASEKESDMMKKAEAQAAEIKSEMEALAIKDAEILKSRRTSVGELEARKLTLAAKQQVVANAFEQAVDALCSLEEDKYIDLLVGYLADTGETSGEVLFNKKDSAGIAEKVVAKANKGGKTFTVSSEVLTIRGGFVLRCRAMEYDSTLETVVNHLKEEMTPQVVSALFN